MSHNQQQVTSPVIGGDGMVANPHAGLDGAGLRWRVTLPLDDWAEATGLPARMCVGTLAVCLYPGLVSNRKTTRRASRCVPPARSFPLSSLYLLVEYWQNGTNASSIARSKSTHTHGEVSFKINRPIRGFVSTRLTPAVRRRRESYAISNSFAIARQSWSISSLPACNPQSSKRRAPARSR